MSFSIEENLSSIRQSIDEALLESSRPKGSINLIAVSKYHSEKEVLAAIKAGQFSFGENYIIEARDKWALLKELLPPQTFSKLSLHLIGHIQKNKVHTAVKIASFIDSVDSIELLELLQKESLKQSKTLPILLELSTNEASKTGFPNTESLDSAVELFSKGVFPNLLLRGFMAMAPLTSDPSAAGATFKNLSSYAKRAAARYQNLPPFTLSMGMTADYKIAIAHGSNEVRIGTAIFGERVKTSDI